MYYGAHDVEQVTECHGLTNLSPKLGTHEVSSEARFAEGFLQTRAEKKLKNIVQATMEMWTVVPRWETLKVDRIGTFQYLKGYHKDEFDFFVMSAGRSKSSHFISALEQAASEVVSLF